MQKAANVDEYIAGYPPEIRKVLEQMRALVKANLPDAEEKISYGMPAYFQNGVVIYYGAHTGHIGVYPTPAGIAEFEADFVNYKTGKGSVQFPYDEPLPEGLISRMIKFRLDKNLQKKTSKKA